MQNTLQIGVNPDFDRASSIHEFTVIHSNGEAMKLDMYKGHVCIAVNVASYCALASSNYKQFNELIEKYGESKGNWRLTIDILHPTAGLRVLAFPCTQFSGAEPEITEHFDVKFDMFEKIDVNGDSASPLWKFLKHKLGGAKGKFIKWDFTKFIINKHGMPVERHECDVEPLQLLQNLETYW